MNKKVIQAVIGLLVSGGFIAWMLWTIEWPEVMAHIARSNYFIFLPVTGVLAVHHVLRAWRWKYLLPDGDKLSLKNLFDALMLGNFASMILPLRAGEFVRPLYLSRKEPTKFASAFISVVIERFFDLSTVLIVFCILMAQFPQLPDWAQNGAYGLGVVAIVLLIFILSAALAPKLVLPFARKMLHPVPKIGPRLVTFTEELALGATVIHRPRNLLLVLIGSALVWGAIFLAYYLYGYLFMSDVSPWLGVATGVIIALAVAAPSAPGFVGVYQIGCIAAFKLLGLDTELGTAFSLLTHVHQFLLIAVYGTYVLMKEGMNLKDLRNGKVPAGE